MIGALTAHGAILLAWALAALALLGVGRVLQRLWGIPANAPRATSQAFWLGYGGSVAVLQLWHLALPVDSRAAALLAAIALAGWWRPPAVARLAPTTLLTLVLVVAWVANRALGPTALFDTGMYHQPSVAWANAWPAVPGLGNLHGRLAFNSGALLFDAVLDLGPLDGRSLHVANGLLVSALLVEACVAARSLKAGSRAPIDVFTIAIFPAVVHAVVRQDVRSLSTDAAVAALVLVTIRALVDLLAPPAGERRTAGHIAAVVFLASTAVTVKLSAAVIGASAALVGVWLAWRSGEESPRGFIARSLPAALLVGGWLAHGIVLSGYPLYPATVLGLDVDWRVPLEQARAEAAWVTMSARNLNSNVIYPGMSWLQPWVRGVVVRGDPFVQFTLPVLLVAGLVLAGLRAVPQARWRAAWIPLGAGAAFWVVAAPHTRMAQGIFWSILAVSVIAWVHERPGRLRWVPRAAFGIALALLAKQAGGAALRATDAPFLAAADALLTRPQDGTWMAPLPLPTVRSITLADGLVVAVPRDDNSCWTLLPCTPHPSVGLARRRPELTPDASLRWGFRHTTSTWSPERWPNPWTPFLSWWRCRRAPGATACPVPAPGA